MDLGNMAMQSTYTCINWTEIKDHVLATLKTHNGMQNRKNCLFYKKIDKTVYSLLSNFWIYCKHKCEKSVKKKNLVFIYLHFKNMAA